MKTCFVYWDNLSYKLLNNDSNYSIGDEQGKPQSITWNNGSHTIRNPDNFSYSFWWDLQCISYDIWLGWTRTTVSSCNPYRTGVNIRNLSRYVTQRKPVSVEIRKSFYSLLCGNVPNYEYRLIITYSNFNCTGTLISNSFLFYGIDPTDVQFSIRENNSSNEPPRQIQITDDGVLYTYPINDTGSVQVINSPPKKKIFIEGNKFDIDDPSSAYKDCNEICPTGTITCECGGLRCCYQKIEKGYQLVKTIYLD